MVNVLAGAMIGGKLSPEISEDELHVFFNYIGQGIWHLQNLENVLATYITMKHDIKTPGAVSEERSQKLLQKNRKGTLGTLLKTAFEHHVMPKDLEERFKSFRDERNWLVHKCAYQNRKDLYSTAKRQALINRILEFCEEAITLRKLVFADLNQFFVNQGCDFSHSIRLANEELAALKSEP